MDPSRRHAVSVLLGIAGTARADAILKLSRFLSPVNGVAVLVDGPTGRLIAANDPDLARTALAAPGSTTKPFVLSSLLKQGRLTADTSFPCPIRLRIAGRKFDCTHPPIAPPMRVETALAYSCNCFVARMAERFSPGEVAKELGGYGFSCVPMADGDRQKMQTLGEEGIRISALNMALSYRRIALAALPPIIAGLKGAVDFGTAQSARVADVEVAGKTGSTGIHGGAASAWFAGFMPALSPRVVVAVMLAGRSGGADAAPIAGEILSAYHQGRL